MGQRMLGRRAIVTGGHKSLGQAIARRFLAEGAKVLITGRDVKGVAAAAAELGEGAFGIAGDVVSAEGPAAVVASATKILGGPADVLVNGAGVFVWRAMLEVTPDDWQRTVDTQLTAPFRMTQALARVLNDAGATQGASVINIGSIHGRVGDANAVPQCAAKAGVEGLTRAAAEALRPLGIRVNAILSGAIEPSSGDRASASLHERITQSDLAQIAVYLGSSESIGVSGACIEAFGVSRPVIGSEPKKK